MNEVFAVFNLSDLISGVTSIIVALVALFLIMKPYSLVRKAIGEDFQRDNIFKPLFIMSFKVRKAIGEDYRLDNSDGFGGWHKDIQGPYVDLELGVGRTSYEKETGVLSMDVQGPGAGYYETYNDKTDTFSR